MRKVKEFEERDKNMKNTRKVGGGIFVNENHKLKH